MLAWVAWFALVIVAIEYLIIQPFRNYMLRWRPEMDEVI